MIVHPQPDRYDFAPADKYVAFGERNGMFVIGHTLVWHSQMPAWVFQDAQGQPLTRDALLARMKDHIQTVVGRYKGRIKGWDVVNEALNEDGTLRATQWMKIIGARLHREGVPVRARGGSRGGALLQRLQPGLRRQARRRGAPRSGRCSIKAFPCRRSDRRSTSS